MPNLSDIREESRIVAMFIGRSKHGKSCAGASFPKPFLDLDFDLRVAGIVGGSNKGLFSKDGIEYKSFPPTRGSLDTFKLYLDQLQVSAINGTFPYKTVQIDSLKSLARLAELGSYKYQKGRDVGNWRISGPSDYAFESNVVHQTIEFFKSLPINFIIAGHIVDRYGLLNPDAEYSERGVIGEKLSIRDQLGENLLATFDNVWRFDKEFVNDKEKYYVEFNTDIAGNAFGFARKRHDITGKNFYEFLQSLIKEGKEKAA